MNSQGSMMIAKTISKDYILIPFLYQSYEAKNFNRKQISDFQGVRVGYEMT